MSQFYPKIVQKYNMNKLISFLQEWYIRKTWNSVITPYTNFANKKWTEVIFLKWAGRTSWYMESLVNLCKGSLISLKRSTSILITYGFYLIPSTTLFTAPPFYSDNSVKICPISNWILHFQSHFRLKQMHIPV